MHTNAVMTPLPSAERTARALMALAPAARSFLTSDEELIRTIVLIARRGMWRQAPVGQTAYEVAEAIYEYAMEHGAGYSGLSIYGPRAFRREATAFVEAWSAA